MSAFYFLSGCITTAAVMLQVQDKTSPWWMLLLPAFGCSFVGAVATANGVR